MQFPAGSRDSRLNGGPMATLDGPLLSSLLHSHSEHGFISVFERVDYDDPARLRSHAHARLLEILAQLTGPEARVQRIRSAIARTQRALDQLPIRPMGHRAIAGFVDADTDGHGMWIALDEPVIPSVTLGRYPRIEPLLDIMISDTGVGVVRCSADTIVVDAYAHGSLSHVMSYRVPEGEGARLKQGPSRRAPMMHSESRVQHDAFARSMDRYTHDTLVTWCAQHLPNLVQRFGWNQLIVWGPADVVQGVEAAVGGSVDILLGGRELIVNEPHDQLCTRLDSVLARESHVRELDVVHQLVDGNRAHAVIGRPQTGRALQERRVDTLVLPATQPYEADNGDALAWREEMLRFAAGQQSDIVVVHGEAAELLRSKGTVAAALRY